MRVPGGARVGRISKPNGLQGKLSIILQPEAGKHIETDHPLFILIDGQRVPFFVEETDLVSSDNAIVKFEFIENLESAREFTGCEVFFDSHKTFDSPKGNGSGDLNSVVGYKAHDQELGLLGEVITYIHHDMNPIFLIDFKGNELMVPAVDEFIKKINHKARSIHFILPEGLTAL
jgi:16S rRNA processing protein RimM